MFKRIRKFLHYCKWLSLRKSFDFTILDDEATLDRIIKDGYSVSRFGEGEFRVIGGGGNGLQDPDSALAERLRETIRDPRNPKCLICLPEPFLRMGDLKWKSRIWWAEYVYAKHPVLRKTIPPGQCYGSATFSRFYIDHTDRNLSEKRLKRIREIWTGKDIYIIEGIYSKLGVGNDLFSEAGSIRRILAPATNAFAKYQDILDAACSLIPKNALILLALGMTATVLAADLSKAGYQAIDIGHIDVEYEWFLMNAREKCRIPGKAVNECGDNHPEETETDPVYAASIIKTIL
jgi:glycosyltransferase family protein